MVEGKSRYVPSSISRLRVNHRVLQDSTEQRGGGEVPLPAVTSLLQHLAPSAQYLRVQTSFKALRGCVKGDVTPATGDDGLAHRFAPRTSPATNRNSSMRFFERDEGAQKTAICLDKTVPLPGAVWSPLEPDYLNATPALDEELSGCTQVFVRGCQSGFECLNDGRSAWESADAEHLPPLKAVGTTGGQYKRAG